MTALELRKLTMEKLQLQLQTNVQQHNENYRTHSAGELPNPRVLQSNRRDIARVKTVMSEKRREERANAKESQDV